MRLSGRLFHRRGPAALINAAKTERTSVSRQVDRPHESWRTTRKLGSLHGDAGDVTRRMQLANVSFHKMWTVWFRGAQICLHLRLWLYSAFVLPVLTYNMGTWGLTKTEILMHITVVTCDRSSVSAGHTVSQTTHSIDVLIPAPLVPLSGLQDGACSDMSSDCHLTPQFSAPSMPTWKTPAPPSSEDAPVVRCRQHYVKTYDALDVSCATLTTSMPCAPSTVARGGI